VRTAQDYQEIIEPGQEIVSSVMPPFRTPTQHLIVVFSGLLHQAFETAVATHLVAVLIKCKECQEPRNTPVTIAAGINTQEIESAAANGQQRRYVLLVDCVVVGQTQFFHCP